MSHIPDPSVITFLMVGCQRCGTTWVDAALREHPEVYLPPQKQTYFFDRHWDKGSSWYLQNFSGVEERHRAVGEVATGYCLPEASLRMAELAPHAKLIMSMRNPVDRAYSYFHSRADEMGWDSFEQALEKDPGLLERGQYIEQIEQLLRHYDREQLLLLFYEELHRSDRAYLRSILEFIGVDPDFESAQFGQRKNAAMFPRLRKSLHRVGLKPFLLSLSGSRFGDSVRRARKRWGGAGYRPMNSETRKRMLEHFQPFNARLEEFTGRDLSEWNR